jgi:hypothetical protein
MSLIEQMLAAPNPRRPQDKRAKQPGAPRRSPDPGIAQWFDRLISLWFAPTSIFADKTLDVYLLRFHLGRHVKIELVA